MVKRNIAIALLILIVIAVFGAAIYMIFPHKPKAEQENRPNSVQPVMKISELFDEAVYMGSYSADTEIYADEQFAAKDVLRAALAKSSGLPENVPVMIESHSYEDLSVVFDDGRTMRSLEQAGVTNVMIVASIPKMSGDVFYAYNVQVKIKESRTPKNTEAPADTAPAVSRVTKVTTMPAWWYNWDDTDETTAAVTAAVSVSKPSWAKVTTAAAVTAKPPVTVQAEHPVTEVPSPSVEPSKEPDPPSPPQQPEDPPSQAAPEPPPQQPADPPAPAEPEPQAPAEPEQAEG